MVVTDLKPCPAYKDSGVAWLGKAQEHPIPLFLIFSFTYPSVLITSSAPFVTYRAGYFVSSASFVIPAKAGIQVHCNGKPISFRCHSRKSGNPGVNA